MSTEQARTLDGLVARLERAAAQLRGGELEPNDAARVVEECASTAAQASAELERLVRSAAAESAATAPGQDRML